MAAFLLQWKGPAVSALRREGRLGGGLSVIFGGPHDHAPDPARAGLCSEDVVYVTFLKGGRLFRLCRLVVADVMPVRDYLLYHLDLGLEEADMPMWALTEHLKLVRPDLGHRIPSGCVDSALVPEFCSPCRVDDVVDDRVVRALRFVPKSGPERPILFDAAGRVRPASLQGWLRLSAGSAALLDGRETAPNREAEV